MAKKKAAKKTAKKKAARKEKTARKLVLKAPGAVLEIDLDLCGDKVKASQALDGIRDKLQRGKYPR